MSKGEQTRQAILDEAFSLASCVGVSGLSIGGLAERTHMSKSGLFAHFGSKEELQRAVLRESQLRFAEAVGAGPAHGVALKERLVRELGDDVIAPGHTPLLDRALDVPALFVHDVDDAEMPHEDSRWLASRFHHAHLVSTAGLGHRRILKDAPVLAEVIRFLERT